MQGKLVESEKNIDRSISTLSAKTTDEMNYFRIILNEKLLVLETKFTSLLDESFSKLSVFLSSINTNLDGQSVEIRKNFDTFNRSSNVIKSDLSSIKHDSFSQIDSRLETFHAEMKELRAHIDKINQSLKFTE